jgi:hypothetical protein
MYLPEISTNGHQTITGEEIISQVISKPGNCKPGTISVDESVATTL